MVGQIPETIQALIKIQNPLMILQRLNPANMSPLVLTVSVTVLVDPTHLPYAAHWTLYRSHPELPGRVQTRRPHRFRSQKTTNTLR